METNMLDILIALVAAGGVVLALLYAVWHAEDI